METAVSTISILPATRDEQHSFANMMVEELLNGEHDILKVWQQMSIVADTLNEIKESNTLKQAVIAELEKYGKDGLTINGCKLTKGQRRNFDFVSCNHSGWYEAVELIESKKAKLKEIEAFLKSMKEPVVIPETGEIINPPTVTVTEYVIVK